jgi:flagellar protein FlaF
MIDMQTAHGMPPAQRAVAAYAAADTCRNSKEQEADVFRRATAALRVASRETKAMLRLQALADNRRLWTTVLDLVRDPENRLPLPLRADLASIGRAVHRVMDDPVPDFDFLIAVNENIAAGLAGEP